MRLTGCFAVGAMAAASLLATDNASAVGTRTFELDSLDKLSGGDVQGASIGSDGVVGPGGRSARSRCQPMLARPQHAP